MWNILTYLILYEARNFNYKALFNIFLVESFIKFNLVKTWELSWKLVQFNRKCCFLLLILRDTSEILWDLNIPLLSKLNAGIICSNEIMLLTKKLFFVWLHLLSGPIIGWISKKEILAVQHTYTLFDISC